mmetsp:Transcript_12338/g.21743  ORF Transcript_12338/g.21743 Transcript_12338/m.21743 type:complete len:94 (-) Transcript_12338:1244-1525(-)
MEKIVTTARPSPEPVLQPRAARYSLIRKLAYLVWQHVESGLHVCILAVGSAGDGCPNPPTIQEANDRDDDEQNPTNRGQDGDQDVELLFFLLR